MRNIVLLRHLKFDQSGPTSFFDKKHNLKKGKSRTKNVCNGHTDESVVIINMSATCLGKPEVFVWLGLTRQKFFVGLA
jgi:hypothetical protein